MAELKSRTDVEAWVNARPIATRQIDSAVLASRAALRILPFVYVKILDNKIQTAQVKAVLYANTAARLAILAPSPATSKAAREAYAAVGGSAAEAAVAAAAAAAADSAYGDIALAAGDAAVAAAYIIDVAESWSAVSRDANRIAEIGALNAMTYPLATMVWRELPIGKRWQLFQNDLRRNRNGHVWIDWYERILTGNAASNEVEEAYLLLDAPEIWKQDFATVCGEIAKRLKAIEEKEKQFKPSKDRDFFISYSTKDEAFAREVNDLVEDAGFTTVVQFRDFKNSNFISEMNKGLARSKRMISVLTDNYAKSDACEAEWNYFFNKDRKSSSRLIVHLLFEDSELLPLQQQIVYTNLIGKKRTDRRALVIEAINHEPKTYSQAEAREALANSASPFVKLGKDDKLTAGPHPTFDTPRAGSELDQIIDALLGFIGPLLKALSRQAPPSTKESLTEYQIHLSKNRKKSIIGLLSGLAAAVQSSKSDADPKDWGNGVLSLLSSVEEYHQRLISFYNEKPRRDRLHSEINLDQDKAYGADLAQPVREVTKAIQDYDGPITEDLKAAFNDLSKVVSGIANDQRETPEDAGLVTPKKSVVLTIIGSLERFYNLAGSTASIVSTPQGQALISALEKALNQLTRFII